MQLLKNGAVAYTTAPVRRPTVLCSTRERRFARRGKTHVFRNRPYAAGERGLENVIAKENTTQRRYARRGKKTGPWERPKRREQRPEI